MSVFHVTVYSHHFAVDGYDRDGKGVVESFALRFAEYQFVRNWTGESQRRLTRIYATATRDRRQMRFHIRSLEDFKDHIVRSGYHADAISLTVVPGFEATPTTFNPSPDFIPRDYQLPIIQFLVAPGFMKVVPLQTGKGKTAITLMAIAELGVRVAVVIRAQYLERWVTDLTGPASVLRLEPHELMVVRGAKDLKAIIALGLAGQLHAKVIVFTGKTLYAFYDHFEQTNQDTHYYGCHPADLYRILGVGVRVIDEVHQDFHFNLTQDLYTHVNKTISLSATLETDKPTVAKMYRLIFPNEVRAKVGEYDKYISVKALMYGLTQETLHKNRLKWTRRGMGSYSHVDFEQSILDNKRMLKSYLAMIREVVDVNYVSVRVAGQRMLVFAATVDMCVAIAKDLAAHFPHLDIYKFTGGDDYTRFMSADIGVSTLMKTGTAVDIPGLRVCLSTTAVDSAESNLQAMGRLRNLRDFPGVTPVFLYLVCSDIPQQLRYHQRKIEKFKGKVLSHGIFTLGTNL